MRQFAQPSTAQSALLLVVQSGRSPMMLVAHRSRRGSVTSTVRMRVLVLAVLQGLSATPDRRAARKLVPFFGLAGGDT